MNETAKYGFTVIVPVYNEEENIAGVFEGLSAFLGNCSLASCVLFVDDGSCDSSLLKIREICEGYKDFYYIALERNSGLSTALKAGIDYVYSPYAGYMDADMQTNPQDFNLLLPELADCDMVTGVRVSRKDSIAKKIQSKIANGFRRMLTGDGAVDTGCPLKVFKTDVIKSLPMFNGFHRFLPALVLLRKDGAYKQIPVRHYPRQYGKSKFTVWNRIRHTFADCFAYRWMKRRYVSYCLKPVNGTDLQTIGKNIRTDDIS